MSDLSIIINGTRYDAVEGPTRLGNCDVCDMNDACGQLTIHSNFCEIFEFIGKIKYFKKSADVKQNSSDWNVKKK